jgi:hypothetical protein
MKLTRFQLDLSVDEMSAIDRWSSMAGFRTKKEFLVNAFTIFQWAAKQVMLGRTICAINEASGEIRHLEMPALAAIAEWGVAPTLSPEERRRRIAEPGQPLSADDFRAGVQDDAEPDRFVDTGGKNGSATDLRKESSVP